MSEAELQRAVIECARLLGWRVAHFRPALTGKGYRTPVEADGQGFPDLVLVRPPRLLAVELKSERGQPTHEQQLWLHGFEACGVSVHVWRPADWIAGTIEAMLR